ncbi:hypothetical protein Glove_303g134 [Diversispora epigaea]|uniref:Zinc-ribbon domain-containing protein n=1 Tax=Diversispora epigaea TaxID=1348612 RepID=A0A397HVL1_9GLOM|nr:hypothetical protein Glove_303g134 [Diversispora epigaea]
MVPTMCSQLLEHARQIAIKRNGVCLSENYINCKLPLKRCCSKGHLWSAPLDRIKNGNKWCPQCANESCLTLKDAQQLARGKNGECLSEIFINSRLTGIYERKGGKCLSEKYYNSYTKLLWCCKENHQWEATPNCILRGKWCPFCSKFKREDLCHEITSKYLGPPSKIQHPMGLELDIYYPEYGLAIEIQGVQHEKYIGFFHRGDSNNFIKQQERNQLKNELCEENWIVLRYVWYYEDPYVVILEHLRELGLI